MLTDALRAAGHRVRPLVRRAAQSADEISWDPAAGKLDPAQLAGTDAVINLAGENISAGRWTAARRERILRSRVDSTRTLVVAIREMSSRPAVFISASAVGYYGDRGDVLLTEASLIGHGFLPEVCLAWETHAQGAARLGVRTAILRFGVVLDGHGGALTKILPVFRLGFGGRLGSGRQWMSWIASDDVAGVVLQALTDSRFSGAFNLVGPQCVTNTEFTAMLARVVERPANFPVPRVVLRLLFGAMADEALLASTRAQPQRLEQLGYSFRHPTLESALRAALA